MQAPVSFLWQPECYYSTLPFIMKGLQLVSKMGWGVGQSAMLHFPCSQLENRRKSNKPVKAKTEIRSIELKSLPLTTKHDY